MEYSYTVFDTQLGWMAIVASEHGLCKLTLPQPAPDKAMTLIADLLPKAVASTASFRDLISRIERYFAGEEVGFPDELDLRTSTAFQESVWRTTRSIPYGETRSYGWIAEQLGRPRSGQAVGKALSCNPLPIIIPCHRVVGSARGVLGGFSGGLELKKRLLHLEISADGRKSQHGIISV